MPIYEYICKKCGERFERLLLKVSSPGDVTCPYCGSEEVEREVSPFMSFSTCPPAATGYG